jgi:predicted dehydrogenase
MATKFSRRHFLATIGGGAATLWARTGRTDTNSVIRCAVLGAGGRGTHLLRLMLKVPDVRVTAVCDIREAHLQRGQDVVEAAGQPRPTGYGQRGAKDYLRMLEVEKLDAVLVATPMQDHAVMSIDALRAGSAVLSEVAAAVTLEECWGLVRAVEETGGLYMLAENVCYFRNCMQVANMIRSGLFGELTYGECGYVHDCRRLHFDANGQLTWRGELARDFIGNLYPTHSLGPVAQWMGINRTDRFVSLVAMTTPARGAARYAAKRFGPESPQAQHRFQKGDSTTTLIKTASGAMIDLRYDTCSSRPHRTTVYHTVQGDTGSYRSLTNDVWIESRSPSYKWQPLADYADEFDDPLWQEWGAQASGSGHGGADFFVVRAFFDSLRNSRPSPIDVYDAVAWSCITPLSAESIRGGSRSVEVPDFTANRVVTPNEAAT